MSKISASKTEQLLVVAIERLDLIVNILALQLTAERSVTEGARALKMVGLDNQTIAAILNTTPAAVRSYTTNLRVKLGKKGGR